MNMNGKSQASALCQDIIAHNSDNMIREQAIEATMQFSVEDAFIAFGSVSEKYKPYLFLVGRPLGLTGDFPEGITQIEYNDPEERSLTGYVYNFTRQNLSELAQKGLFDKDFEVPEIIKSNVFELPCTASCTVVKAGGALKSMQVFADINAASMRCTDDESGYTISEYFRAVPEPTDNKDIIMEKREDIYAKTLREQAAFYEADKDESKLVVQAEPEELDLDRDEGVDADKEAKTQTGAENKAEKGRDVSDIRTPEENYDYDEEDEYLN